MNGHYHITFKNGQTINEKSLETTIKQLKKVRSPITEFGFCCTYGCGKLHPFTPVELKTLAAGTKKALPTMDWMSCGGPTLAPGQSYSISFHDQDHCRFEKIDETMADKIKQKKVLVYLLAVVDEHDAMIRMFTTEERDRLEEILGHPLKVHAMGLATEDILLLLLSKDGHVFSCIFNHWKQDQLPPETRGAELLIGYRTNTRLEYCGALGQAEITKLESAGIKLSPNYAANVAAMHPEKGFMVHREGLATTWHHSLDVFLMMHCAQDLQFSIRREGNKGLSIDEAIIVGLLKAALKPKATDAALPEGWRYTARFTSGDVTATVLESEFVCRLKASQGLLSMVVTDADGKEVRDLDGEERRELIRLGYDVRGEIKKGVTGMRSPDLVPQKKAAEPAKQEVGLHVVCPDGLVRVVTAQQIESLLQASATVYQDCLAMAASLRYGSGQLPGLSAHLLETSLDSIYGHKKD